MLPKEEFYLLVNKFGSDKNYRSFYAWDELVTMGWAYNFYKQFAQWAQEGVCFVIRQKKNAKCEIL